MFKGKTKYHGTTDILRFEQLSNLLRIFQIAFGYMKHNLQSTMNTKFGQSNRHRCILSSRRALLYN
jgi:hypothetical protein